MFVYHFVYFLYSPAQIGGLEATHSVGLQQLFPLDLSFLQVLVEVVSPHYSVVL